MRWWTVAIGIAGLTGCGPDPEAGAEHYDDTCGACHGASGDLGVAVNGTAAADLNEVVPEKSDDELEAIILNGTGDMPAPPLSTGEARDVIAYLRETFGGGE